MHTHTQKVLITPSEQRRKQQVQRLARAPYEGVYNFQLLSGETDTSILEDLMDLVNFSTFQISSENREMVHILKYFLLNA